MADWYSRPVLFVASIEDALGFYLGDMDFTKDWEYYEDPGELLVAQVSRNGLEIILQKDPSRAGGGRIFLSLTDKQMELWQNEIEHAQIPVTRKEWGMPVLEILDRDGNQLFFTADSLKQD